MSRSRKKPYITDQQKGGRSRPAKRQAARAVRQTEDTPANGRAYRKEFCSWNIRDWSFYSRDPKARRK